MATIVYLLGIAVAGLVLYLIAKDAKRTEVGRIVFFVGLLWLVQILAAKTFHF
jgi:hypothetical protein